MSLTPRELDKLYIFTMAEVSRRRKDRGLQLSVPEATAIVSEACIEAARDGKTVAEVMEIGTQVTAADIQMPANCELVSEPETLVINIVEPEEEELPEPGEEGEDDTTEPEAENDGDAADGSADEPENSPRGNAEGDE